jgi:hypothetical protein
MSICLIQGRRREQMPTLPSHATTHDHKLEFSDFVAFVQLHAFTQELKIWASPVSATADPGTGML